MRRHDDMHLAIARCEYEHVQPVIDISEGLKPPLRILLASGHRAGA